jgi:VWFA-related protein
MRRMRKTFASFLLSGALALVAQSPSQVTIRVPVRLVNMPTLVFSKDGRILPGLQRNDFRVFDNGQPQQVALETASMPVSIALAVQLNEDVRAYIPFIVKAGSIVDTLLVGATGEAAVVAYSDAVSLVKPFEAGDVQSALKVVPAHGTHARMIDAGLRAIALLKQRPASRTRVLIFIGQAMDSGSESGLDVLKEQAERENVAIYALALPQFGKAFVSDTFSLQGLSSSSDKGGFKAGVDLGKLISVLNRRSKAEKSVDPFSILTAATGGTQLHFRKSKEFEDAIATIGMELRSVYQLNYYPSSTQAGYHRIQIEVDVPGATAYNRPGYWLGAN